jgi:hypothetical protein
MCPPEPPNTSDPEDAARAALGSLCLPPGLVDVLCERLIDGGATSTEDQRRLIEDRLHAIVEYLAVGTPPGPPGASPDLPFESTLAVWQDGLASVVDHLAGAIQAAADTGQLDRNWASGFQTLLLRLPQLQVHALHDLVDVHAASGLISRPGFPFSWHHVAMIEDRSGRPVNEAELRGAFAECSVAVKPTSDDRRVLWFARPTPWTDEAVQALVETAVALGLKGSISDPGQGVDGVQCALARRLADPGRRERR